MEEQKPEACVSFTLRWSASDDLPKDRPFFAYFTRTWIATIHWDDRAGALVDSLNRPIIGTPVLWAEIPSAIEMRAAFRAACDVEHEAANASH